MEHEKSRAECAWYRQTVSDWEQTYGEGKEEKTKSIRARLKQHEEQVKQRECRKALSREGTEGRDKRKYQMKKYFVGENGISYTLRGDGLYYPDLKLPEGTDYSIGKYGRMRRRYLQEYRKVEYIRLLLNGGLNEDLHSVDVECEQRVETLIEQMMERWGVTEQLKAENQMLWVRMFNNIRHSAEEVVLVEVVYS